MCGWYFEQGDLLFHCIDLCTRKNIIQIAIMLSTLIDSYMIMRNKSRLLRSPRRHSRDSVIIMNFNFILELVEYFETKQNHFFYCTELDHDLHWPYTTYAWASKVGSERDKTSLYGCQVNTSKSDFIYLIHRTIA